MLFTSPVSGQNVKPDRCIIYSKYVFYTDEKPQGGSWGKTKTGGKVVDVLQVVDVSIINQEVCKKQWNSIQCTLPANVICTGGHGTNKGFRQVCFLFSNLKS